MSDNRLMHATAVVVNNCGILLTGKSGSGKSDLALRLIETKNAVLVADDAVLLEKKGQKLYARPAENIAGLLEVRGVGLVKYPYIEESYYYVVNGDKEEFSIRDERARLNGDSKKK